MTAMMKISGGALFSPDRRHRLHLWRNLAPLAATQRRVCFVMLNPSVADEDRPDPTLTRCVGFAAREGGTRLDVVNLYSLVTPYPAVLWSRPPGDRVTTDTDSVIRSVVAEAAVVIVAWGGGGDVCPERVREVRGMLPKELWCLGTTASGQPRHPVRLALSTPLEPWGT